jgi:hypothetical protein
MTLLRPGDTLPALTVTPAGAGALALPEALGGHFGVVRLLVPVLQRPAARVPTRS